MAKLQLAEAPLDYSPYIPVKNPSGALIYVREDYFDNMSEAAYEEFENRNFDTMIEEGNYLSEGEYLADRAERKRRREERTRQKEEKKAAKTDKKKATADKRRAKGEAKKIKAEAKKAKAEAGGGDEEGESKFDKWSSKAMDIYGKIKGGGGDSGGEAGGEPKKDNTMLYIGLGVGALVLIGGAIILSKPKKAA